jgi:ubiquitin-conjugating enzyme E2 J1
MTSQFSLKNTGVRRIMEEVSEMKKDPSDQYFATPLEDNIFDWHFTLRGPKGTDFEGGFYHGRILLPSGYPFKPPNIYFLNENGRFEIKKKICLSFSAYHPEEWQPAWGIRTILEAIISFMPSKSEGAIGGLNWSKEERKKCVKKSLSYKCPHCGSIKDLVPAEANSDEDGTKKSTNKYADAIAQLHFHAPGSNANSKESGRKALKPSVSLGNLKEEEKIKSGTAEVTAMPTNDINTANKTSNISRRNVNNKDNNNNDNNVRQNTSSVNNTVAQNEEDVDIEKMLEYVRQSDTAGDSILRHVMTILNFLITILICRKVFYFISSMFYKKFHGV